MTDAFVQVAVAVGVADGDTGVVAAGDEGVGVAVAGAGVVGAGPETGALVVVHPATAAAVNSKAIRRTATRA